MTEHSFSQFVYFDTNIWSELAKNVDLVKGVYDFLIKNDLTVAISGPNLLEIKDANRMHSNFLDLISSLPTRLIKNDDEILQEEVNAYPSKRIQSLVSDQPINFGDLHLDFFQMKKISDTRTEQQLHAKNLGEKLLKLKGNFPHDKNGSYSWIQSREFASCKVIENLYQYHFDFLLLNQNNLDFELNNFLSLRILSYVVFKRYYISGNLVKDPSEHGDLMHLYAIPYCRLAVMERNLCEDLRQIKRKSDVLDNTEIANIDFIRNPQNYQRIFTRGDAK